MNVDQFLGFHLPAVKRDDATEAVAIGGDSKKWDGDTNFEMRRWRPGKEAEPPGQLYFCAATVWAESARQGRLYRSDEDLIKTYVVVLDDIGTAKPQDPNKIVIPPDRIKVAPTTILETSPNNHQYFYKLKYGADPFEVAALLVAAAAAGWTDPGSTKAGQVFRVPGATNAKHNGFRARVVEHHPERVWSFAELVVEFGKHGIVSRVVKPLAEALPPLKPGEVDPTLDLLEKLNMVLGEAKRGWLPVPCPNEVEHTTGERGDNSTGYKPSHGGGVFRCRHGHCVDRITTEDFRAWLFKQLIPDLAAFGQRLADITSQARSSTNNSDRRADPDGVEFNQAANRVRKRIMEDLVHVATETKYWSVKANNFIEYGAIDHDLYAIMLRHGLLEGLTPAGRETIIQPSAWLKREPDTRRVARTTHRLGGPLIVDDCLNIAPPLPPRLVVDGDPEPWLELVDFVCGAQAELMLDWMAMVVTAWDRKPGWHPMIKGTMHGIGKALMFTPLVNYLAPEHWYGLKVEDLGDKFTEFLEKRLVVFDELKRTTKGQATLSDIYNTLKAWLAGGTGWVIIQHKSLKPYAALDLSCWVILSNQDVPLPIEASDRRLLVIETPPQPREEKWYAAFLEWRDAGGWRQVIAWLHWRWDTMPAEDRQRLMGRAPMTEAKADLIENSAEGIDGAVRAHIAGNDCEPWPDLLTLDDVTRMLRDSRKLSDYIKNRILNDQTISRALRNNGAVKLFKGAQVRDGESRLRLWCVRGIKLADYEKLETGKEIIDVYRAMSATGRPTVMPKGGKIVDFKPK